jgi:ABC-type sugar transport system ATPase subunit
MRLEVTKLQRQLATTAIYVTHDQIEAMTMADQIVVLNAGNIEQYGSPLELYERPANLFVAGFIGLPRMNFIGGQRRSATAPRRLASGPSISKQAMTVKAGRVWCLSPSTSAATRSFTLRCRRSVVSTLARSVSSASHRAIAFGCFLIPVASIGSIARARR